MDFVIPRFSLYFVFTVALLWSCDSHAQRVHVAVASNFIAAAEQLVEEYQKTAPGDIVLSFGSSGKIFAQIVQGAPFDIFLSADQDKPQTLIARGLVKSDDRFTYAKGALVLWSTDSLLLHDSKGIRSLVDVNVDKIAMANPRTAPYGKAALQALQSLGVENKFRGKTVTGESISQTFMFVQSKNAQLGFIAYAQYLQLPKSKMGSAWLVPPELHEPIRQDAVVLKNASVKAREVFEFLKSSQAKRIIEKYGYQTTAIDTGEIVESHRR